MKKPGHPQRRPAPLPSMTSEFKTSARGLRQSAALATVVGLANLAGAIVIFQQPAIRIACLLIALICGWAVFTALRMAMDQRVALSIGPQGLFYRPFGAQVVPWSDITAIAVIRSYARHVVMGRASWPRQPQLDMINFAVANPRSYPGGIGRAISRMLQRQFSRPPIAIQVGLVDASLEEIAVAIDASWTGQIQYIDDRPAGA